MNVPEGQAYLSWYYDTGIWRKTTFLGVPCLKSVCDMWNYQEILFALKPAFIIEFGTYFGGSALYFAEMLQRISAGAPVLTVDIDHAKVFDSVRNHPDIEMLEVDSTSAAVAKRVLQLREQYPGKAFFIADSDHTKAHVLGELMQLRALTLPGDYVVIEDGVINGNPVLPGWGEGPLEALDEYLSKYPDDYSQDLEREQAFGFTFAPKGFLIRR
jgi:cephalosporin hydroxylase